VSREERIQEVLKLLRDGNLSPFNVVLKVLDERKPAYFGYRNELYKESNKKLSLILDCILAAAADAGKRKLWSWMRPHALAIVCEMIDEEMYTVTKEDRLSGLSDMTPDFIKSWTVALMS